MKEEMVSIEEDLRPDLSASTDELDSIEDLRLDLGSSPKELTPILEVSQLEALPTGAADKGCGVDLGSPTVVVPNGVMVEDVVLVTDVGVLAEGARGDGDLAVDDELPSVQSPMRPSSSCLSAIVVILTADRMLPLVLVDGLLEVVDRNCFIVGGGDGGAAASGDGAVDGVTVQVVSGGAGMVAAGVPAIPIGYCQVGEASSIVVVQDRAWLVQVGL
ncbi:hypothetical protein Dimus_010633 [Dionaea muscipula]